MSYWMDMKETPDLESYLFNVIPEPHIVFQANDPTFTIAAENIAHSEIAHTVPSEIVGRPLFDVFPDTSEKYLKTGESDLIESFRTAIRTKKPHPMSALRYDIKDQDGKLAVRYWQVVHYAIFDENGKAQYVVQSTRDITEERDANERLSEAQRQLDQALSVGLIGTWSWDVVKNILIADRNLARMFGVGQEEAATGLPLDVFTNSIHPLDKNKVLKAISEVVQTKGSFEQEYRTVSTDGTIRWVIARGKIETDDKGKAVHFPGVIVDITDRRHAELNTEFLSRASTVLSSSLDYKKALVTVSKLACDYVADWCRIDLWDKETDTINRLAIYHKDKAKMALSQGLVQSEEGLRRMLKTGEPQFYPLITMDMIRASIKDPHQLHIYEELGITSLMMVPISDASGPIGAVTFVSAEQKHHYDDGDMAMVREFASRAALAVTNARLYETAEKELAQRRKLEEDLRQANENLEKRVAERTAALKHTNQSLERSNQELQDFAYVASHDLQEPLRKIQAFSNLLVDEYGETLGDGSDYLERMRSAASRMSVLIEDLLEFSRVTTKAKPHEQVDLNQIVADVINDLEIRIKDTGGIIESDDLPTIVADPLQMRQLFQNLLANALKFHKPDVAPIVKIHAVAQHKNDTIDAYTLTVSDNGIGFDDKYASKVFAVFQRLHGRDNYEGTGIGLAVCRKIVERHGGSITATSQPEQGATFTIKLPTQPAGDHTT
ncbi:MAG: domain S-box protein [Candidatus Saccharibacteria bacterium]|nr:domain S-box protein [Candidatus Saccharibacteria bacterium]